MMVHRRANKKAPSQPLDADLFLNHHRQRLADEDPPDDQKEKLLFDQDRDGAQQSPQRHRTSIPHDHIGRVGIEPQKTQTGAKDDRTDHRNLTDSRHKGEDEERRNLRVAGYVGKNPENSYDKRRRHNRQPVDSVGDIDGIGNRGNGKDNKGHIGPGKVNYRVFEKRQIELRRQPRRQWRKPFGDIDNAEGRAVGDLQYQFGRFG